MEFKTKFKVGDRVWFMESNRPECAAITAINIRTWASNRFHAISGDGMPFDANTKIEYIMTESRHSCYVDHTREEANVFSNKEELIKSL